MLDASRATMGILRLRPGETDLAALVREQVHEARARTAQHKIHIDAPADPAMGVWDALVLEQVVGNLLDNAIRYSPNGGDIHVTLATGADEARLTVVESGIGIPAEALPMLFQRYFRHDDAKQVTSKGLGIGLYVSHEIVRAHGGRIDVRSEPGKGASFTVTLPLHPAAPAPTGALASSACDPTRTLP